MTNVLKKLIGYGYTDNKGIATLDYTEDGTDITTLQPTGETGYIGNGVGSVQVEAEIHDNSILVSVPCNVLDCLFYDTLTTGTVPSMIKKTGSMELTSDDNGLTMNNSTTSYQYVGFDKEKSSSTLSDWIDWIDFAFEFELISSENPSSSTVELRPQTSSARQYLLSGFSNNDKIKIEYRNDGSIKQFKNDVLQSTYSFKANELTSIRFMVQKNAKIIIKNVKIWSI